MSQRPPGATAAARWLQTTRLVALSPLGIGFVSALLPRRGRLPSLRRGAAGLRVRALESLPRVGAPRARVRRVGGGAASDLAARAAAARAGPGSSSCRTLPISSPTSSTCAGFSRCPMPSMLALLALAGLLIGVRSVQLVQGCVERLWGVRAGWTAVHAIAVLTAFGIYLGRVKRWNSWTLMEDPHALAHDVRAVPAEPRRRARARRHDRLRDRVLDRLPRSRRPEPGGRAPRVVADAAWRRRLTAHKGPDPDPRARLGPGPDCTLVRAALRAPRP